MKRIITTERIRNIFQKASKCRIAVFGDLMLDVYLQGTATRLSPEAPVPILNVHSRMNRPGGAANVMRNIRALGAEASACGVIGDDGTGRVLTDMLQESGVEISGIVIDKARRTTEKLRALAGAQQLVRLDFEDTEPVPSSVLEQTADNLVRDIRKGRINAVVFEDYAKGLLNTEMVQMIADTAREHGVFTSLDPHPGHELRIKKLSLMTPNRLEAFGLAGMYCYPPVTPVENDQPLRKVADRVMADWEPGTLLITLGAQGMALFKEGSPLLTIPTKAREVFDVSGAGDTVIATYTLCVAAGASEPEAAAIANYAAGVVVGKVGTATASVDEILDVCGADND